MQKHERQALYVLLMSATDMVSLSLPDLARAIHESGTRGHRPFVAVQCGALPLASLERKLFGDEAGALTGAGSPTPGVFETAEGGTVFLEEIAALSPSLQDAVVRALEGRAVRRAGGMRTARVDVRVMATQTDLDAAVLSGRIRPELSARLRVIPLRGQAGGDPGNAQMLVLDAPASTGRGPDSAEAGIPFPATMTEIERMAAKLMVERVGGNKSAAADALRISRSRLYRLLNGVV